MSAREGRCAGKTVIISGGASGMGASHARTLAAEGANVVIADLNVDQAKELAEEINGSLGREVALAALLDVADFSSWERVVASAVERFGSLQGLVNNAGIASSGSVEESTLENWHAAINVNLTGCFYGMKACVPELKKNEWSSIVNVSSIAGLVGFRHRVGYSASKWGVVGLTKTSAMDLGPEGIRVNSINPGSITTPMTAHLKRTLGQVPQNRAAEVDEVSPLIVYLISDESRFVNGSTIAIDGGETAGNNLRPFQ